MAAPNGTSQVYHTETGALPFPIDPKLIQVLRQIPGWHSQVRRAVTLQTITREPGEKACAGDMGGTLTAGLPF